MKVFKSITIGRSADELYSYWHDFANLPNFMKHVESVVVNPDGKHSHWKVSAPAGTSVEWDAVITNDTPGQEIAWRSLENADVRNAGMVRFVPAGGSTEVQVQITYDPPAGALGVAIARLFGEEPEIQVDEDLKRFKEIMEAGPATRPVPA